VTVFLLTDKIAFPPPHLASKEGLLAVGGDLSRKRLLLAYRMGIFPWFSDDEPILWWSPDPRLVLYPHEIKVSKTLSKIIKKEVFKVTMDTAFVQVINQCAQIRLENNQGTWIVKDMIDAYCTLHESGFAHSVEAWYQGELAGGLYGVSLGRCFFGESMFTRISNASNVALVKLVEYLKALSFDMIDCQLTTQHLLRFGAREIPRAKFLIQLEESLKASTKKGKWSFDSPKFHGLEQKF
jgi:leucyl/phenylalanyl-tRNA--protein transferase